jgi:DNA repair protein RecN (Recombination protein N)
MIERGTLTPLTKAFERPSHLAVDDALDLSFESGMSTVTGETGAGKSILLQALNLVLGHRSDSALVRHGQDKAEVSAAFDVAGHKKIQNYLQAQSLDADSECILRRIITSDGRSKAFVNGVNVPLSIMKGVGELLIDMPDSKDKSSASTTAKFLTDN